MEALLILLAGGVIVGFSLMENRNRLRIWERAVTACGLQVLETSSFLRPRLRAYAGPLEVRIEAHGDRGRLTRLVVMTPGPPDFHGVSIRPQKTFHLGRENEIGDGQFDSEFFIEGPPQLVLALLDREMRHLLTARKDESRLEIYSGQVRAVLPKDTKVRDVLRHVLEIQKRLAPPVEIGRRLAENATQDPEPGVRLQNLLLLIHERRRAPETVGALRKACSDPIPEIRLRAARSLGVEGRGVLLDLAEKLEDDAASAEALSIVGDELPFERVNATLELALSRHHLRSVQACVGIIGRHEALAADKPGSRAAEPLLVQTLQHDLPELRLAAANALAKVGTAAAVLPLKEVAERSRLDLDLRRATRQAIAEIQSRAEGASPGQLSLAGADAGQLSLAQDPAGRLAIHDDAAET